MLVQESNIMEVIKRIKKEKVVALDFETISLKDKTPVAMSFACGKDVYFVPLKMKYFMNVSEDGLNTLLIELVQHELVFHHSAFDLQVLANIGIVLTNAPHDTLIISHILNENESHKLKDLTAKYLKYDMIKFKEVCGTGKKQIGFHDVQDKELAEKYASDDAKYTLQLFNLMYPQIQKDKMFIMVYGIEKELLLVVNDMHLQGVPVAKSKIAKVRKTCEEQVENFKGKLDYYMADVNLNSPKQLKEYFIDKKRLPIHKRSQRTNEPSVDAEVLKKYADAGSREAKWILKYREYNKILSTFVPALQPDDEGLIHPHFHQVGTTSGRFSSSEPNFQNIPAHDDLDIRDVITAPKGYTFVGADYSQMELRLAGHFSQDKNMLRIFQKGLDIHTETATKVGCPRSPDAKTINFGILYGMGVQALAKNIKKTRMEATQYIHDYYKTYPDLQKWLVKSRQEAFDNKEVSLLYGRKRHLQTTMKTSQIGRRVEC